MDGEQEAHGGVPGDKNESRGRGSDRRLYAQGLEGRAQTAYTAAMQRLIASYFLWITMGLLAASSARAMHPCEELLSLMRGDSVELFIKGGENRTERIVVLRPSLSGRGIRSVKFGRPKYFSEDDIDLPLSLRLARLKRHPLYGQPSRSVRACEPKSSDLDATLSANGYRIITTFKSPSPDEELIIHTEYRKIFGTRKEVTILRVYGHWYYEIGGKCYEDGDGFISVVKPLDLSTVFAEYLNERMDFLGQNGSGQLRADLFNEYAETFHLDGGSAEYLIDVIHRRAESQGTYALGSLGHIFEIQRGQSLHFVGEEHPNIPPLLHAAPPNIGDRMFLRLRSAEPKIEISQTLPD